MTFNEISKDLAKHLSPKRYRHVLGVVEAAEELAKVYEVDIKKARLAALLHDCAKEEKLDAMQAVVKVAGLILDQDMQVPFWLRPGMGWMIQPSVKLFGFIRWGNHICQTWIR